MSNEETEHLDSSPLVADNQHSGGFMDTTSRSERMKELRERIRKGDYKVSPSRVAMALWEATREALTGFQPASR